MAQQVEHSQQEAVRRLQLFVVGSEPNSQRARENIREIADTLLDSRYELQIIDILQNHQLAVDQGVLVVPTLVALAPGKRVTISGDLSDTEQVLAALRGLEDDPGSEIPA